MDMLMIKLSTKFMKGIVAKIVSRKVYKKLGYKIDIQFNDVQIDMINGDVKLHVDADAKMNKTEFEMAFLFLFREIYMFFNEEKITSIGRGQAVTSIKCGAGLSPVILFYFCFY